MAMSPNREAARWRTPDADHGRTFRPQYWALVVTVIALTLTTQLITRGLPAALARSSPETALMLRADHPDALLIQAEASLAAATASLNEALQKKQSVDQQAETAKPAPTLPLTRREQQRLEEHLKTVLLHAPMRAKALALLGELAFLGADGKDPAPLMIAAIRQSPRMAVAAIWLIHRHNEKDLPEKVLGYIDLVLRAKPKVARFLAPTLARFAETPGATEPLANLLATDPPWRTMIFADVPRYTKDPRTTLRLFEKLKATSHPPTQSEWRTYLNGLMQQNKTELAYYAWLQSLPPHELKKAGYLYNGNFETAPSGTPFDWQYADDDGVSIEQKKIREPQSKGALFLTFGPGRVQFDGVTQRTMLPPGDYRITGQLKGQINGRRGLVWALKCEDDTKRILGESAMFVGDVASWSPFEFSLTVPNGTCRPQRLELRLDARSASEKIVTGTVAFTNLSITRNKAPRPANALQPEDQ